MQKIMSTDVNSTFNKPHIKLSLYYHTASAKVKNFDVDEIIMERHM